MSGFPSPLSLEAGTILGFPSWRFSLGDVFICAGLRIYRHLFLIFFFYINLFWNNLGIYRRVAKIQHREFLYTPPWFPYEYLT